MQVVREPPNAFAAHGIPLHPRSCIHLVILAILFIRWWWRLLLLDELLPVQRTRRVELEPGLYALEIEEMVFMAWKAND